MRLTRIIRIFGAPPLAVGRDLVDPSGELLITPVFRDQYSDAVLGRPAALGALDPHDAQLADQLAEGDCTVGIVHNNQLIAKFAA